MQQKPMQEVKDIEGRTVEAIIATLNTPDTQKDTVRSGFFDYRPMEATIVPAHEWRHVPLGKAFVFERGQEVHARLLFNSTKAADEWLEAIRFDFTHGTHPLQQWSWGFTPHVDATTPTKGGRELHARRSTGEPGIQLVEIGPVLRAASVGTRTVAIKSQEWRVAMLRRLEERQRWR